MPIPPVVRASNRRYPEPGPIEKGIPIPKGPGRAEKGQSKYPLADMEVGDSFLVTEAKTSGFSGTFDNFRIRHPDKAAWRFSTRTVQHEGQKAIRIWRVA
jgi:hypothetical protein